MGIVAPRSARRVAAARAGVSPDNEQRGQIGVADEDHPRLRRRPRICAKRWMRCRMSGRFTREPFGKGYLAPRSWRRSRRRSRDADFRTVGDMGRKSGGCDLAQTEIVRRHQRRVVLAGQQAGGRVVHQDQLDARLGHPAVRGATCSFATGREMIASGRCEISRSSSATCMSGKRRSPRVRRLPRRNRRKCPSCRPVAACPVAFQGVQDHGDAPSGGLSGGAVVG